MSIIPALVTSGIADKIAEVGAHIIDRIWPDKIAQEAERTKAQLALMQMQQSGQIDLLTTQISAILAEANSSDPWTSRARPTFLYVMYIMIFMAIPMGVISVFSPGTPEIIAGGMRAWLTAIPDELYALFGVGYLGYTGFRSWDKKNGAVR
jgi:hypothetical protein